MAYFTRVASDTEVAYKLVAEPILKPPAGEQQTEEAVEQALEEATNPADLQGKPRSISLILITPVLVAFQQKNSRAKSRA